MPCAVRAGIQILGGTHMTARNRRDAAASHRIDSHRPRGRGLRRLAALGVAAAASAAFVAPASADVTAGHSVATMPNTSGLELSGYTPGQSLTIGVLHGGATIGTATGRAGAAGHLTIDGGTGGCWNGAPAQNRPGGTGSRRGRGL